VTSDVTEDAVDVGQLTTDELVPDDAVHLSGVRTYRVRDGIAPLAVVDEKVGGGEWQRTHLVLLHHWRCHTSSVTQRLSNS